MEKSLTSKNGKAQQTKVWSCGYEDCPHNRYWPRQFLYTTVYEHHVWGSDKKFRNGEDTCGMPQFIFLADLEGAAVVSRKYSHKSGSEDTSWNRNEMETEQRRSRNEGTNLPTSWLHQVDVDPIYNKKRTEQNFLKPLAATCRLNPQISTITTKWKRSKRSPGTVSDQVSAARKPEYRYVKAVF